MGVEVFDDGDLGQLRDSLSNSKFFKFKLGPNKVRIVRWKDKDGKLRTAAKRMEHFIPGGGAPTVCTGKGCPVCDKAARMQSSNDDKSKELGKRMRAQTRVYFNLIDRNNEAAGVQVVAFPYKCAKDTLDLLNDPEYNQPHSMLDLEHGRDLKITQSKEGNQTSYSVVAAPAPSKVEVGETIDLETYLNRGSAKKDAPTPATEGKPAQDTTPKPSCYQDKETFDVGSDMCQQCEFVKTCGQ